MFRTAGCARDCIARALSRAGVYQVDAGIPAMGSDELRRQTQDGLRHLAGCVARGKEFGLCISADVEDASRVDCLFDELFAVSEQEGADRFLFGVTLGILDAKGRARFVSSRI